MTPWGTWSEIGLVALLTAIIVVAPKIGAIGSAVGRWLHRP